MDLYETDIEEDVDALRRIDARSVDAWMRAAAYAAGDDPELLLGAARGESAPAELYLVR
jgi:hypothetical protein